MYYHEEDYDGIVLRIPNFFIQVNNLDESVENFLKAINSADN